jgi:hypothetical protein
MSTRRRSGISQVRWVDSPRSRTHSSETDSATLRAPSVYAPTPQRPFDPLETGRKGWAAACAKGDNSARIAHCSLIDDQTVRPGVRAASSSKADAGQRLCTRRFDRFRRGDKANSEEGGENMESNAVAVWFSRTDRASVETISTLDAETQAKAGVLAACSERPAAAPGAQASLSL